MSSSEFWLSLLSNGLATLIAGTILGGVFAIFVNRISHKEERAASEQEQKISEAKKVLAFLNFLKQEIEDIIDFFTIYDKKIDDIALMNYVNFNTSYWEILKSSGEIPVLFDTTSLEIFTNFYYSIEKCNWLYERFLDAENNGRTNIELIIFNEYKKEIHSIQNLIETMKIDLIIIQVIESKSEEIVSLEQSRKRKRSINQRTKNRN